MFIRTERSVKDFIQFYPVVSTIIMINLVLFLFTYIIPLSIGDVILRWGVGHNLSIYHGEYWRIITPVFLHGGVGHVIFNSFALVLFGPALEQMLGKVRFTFAYLLTGIFGNLGTYFIDPTSMVAHLGASGAIYGLFGIYIYMVLFRKDLIDYRNAQIVIVIFVIGLVMTFIRPNINIAAHLFGFIGGFAIGPAMLKNTRPFSMARNRPWRKIDGEVQFDPNRWNKRRWLPRSLRKNIVWIIFGILVIIGFISRYF